MRFWSAFLFATAFSCGLTPHRPTSFVMDGEQVLSTVEHHRLDSLLRAHEQRTGNEVVVVTTPSTDTLTMPEFARSFGHALGIGKKGRDNGVVIAYSQAQRSVFISTGLGTARVLTDSICAVIVDSLMIPRFKEGKAFAGIWNGTTAIVGFLEQPQNAIP